MAFLDETGLAELWSLTKGYADGKARVATGSYTGTGKYGSSNKNSLTFDFVPKFVMVAYGMGTLVGGQEIQQMDVAAILPTVGGFSFAALALGGQAYTVGASVSGNTVSWWSTDAEHQLNTSGRTYQYIAIG